MTHVVRSRCSSGPDSSPATGSGVTSCRPVAGRHELAEHHRIRRSVFVTEQRLFDDDRDVYDGAAGTVHVLGLVDGVPAGAVRLYPLGSDGIWKGDRLAVLREHRHSGIGAPLVRYAVATAAALGGTRMLAQVQARNTTFFLRLGWSTTGAPADHLGVPHQWMAIELT